MKNHQSALTIARWIMLRQGVEPLFDHLDAERINYLVLKGWAFMGDIYREPYDRPIGDIDILIHPQNLPGVVSKLHSLGFNCFLGTQFIQKLESMAINQYPLELSFHNTQGGNIDLHTHIMPSSWAQPAYEIEMDAIWKNRQSFTDWTGRKLNRLSYEHTFLHLITHIMRHDLGTQSQQSYRDLDLWVRKYQTEINWAEILAVSNQWGLNTALCFITTYSYILLKTPFPQEFLNGMKFSLRCQNWLRKLVPLPAVRNLKKLPYWRIIIAKLLLIDHPNKIIKHLINSLFPSRQFRQSIHGPKATLLHHWLAVFQKIIS